MADVYIYIYIILVELAIEAEKIHIPGSFLIALRLSPVYNMNTWMGLATREAKDIQSHFFLMYLKDTVLAFLTSVYSNNYMLLEISSCNFCNTNAQLLDLIINQRSCILVPK